MSECMTTRSGWTPVRNGPLYCSPNCGCKCTYDAFEAATASANELCSTLGDGWEPCVWENGGWHFSAKKGCAELFPVRKSQSNSCTVYFDSKAGQVVVRGEGYRQTLDACLAAARAKIYHFQCDLELVFMTDRPPSSPSCLRVNQNPASHEGRKE
jgi:hypothetical protein